MFLIICPQKCPIPMRGDAEPASVVKFRFISPGQVAGGSNYALTRGATWTQSFSQGLLM